MFSDHYTLSNVLQLYVCYWVTYVCTSSCKPQRTFITIGQLSSPVRAANPRGHSLLLGSYLLLCELQTPEDIHYYWAAIFSCASCKPQRTFITIGQLSSPVRAATPRGHSLLLGSYLLLCELQPPEDIHYYWAAIFSCASCKPQRTFITIGQLSSPVRAEYMSSLVHIMCSKASFKGDPIRHGKIYITLLLVS